MSATPRVWAPSRTRRNLIYLVALLALLLIGLALGVARPQSTDFPAALEWSIRPPIDNFQS